MRPFEYANPQTEAEALDLLNDHDANTAVLAGGTDLLSLLKADVIAPPQRVVDIKNVASMQGVRQEGEGVSIGTLTTLEDALESPLLADYRSLLEVIDGHRAIQIQQMGTIGGDLCHLPNCWYFRNGYGLLGMENGKSLVENGDNRYHAIMGNHGPAKFVSASRFAPALLAWGAKVRIIGPAADQEELLPLEYFYITPKSPVQGVTVLKPGQLISHVWLPAARGQHSAVYEVLASEGLDWPLAAAAVALDIEGDLVRKARIVMGHVAPIPWASHEAASLVLGKTIDAETAEMAAATAVAGATPLSGNDYKVQLAQTAVKRALLRAVGKLEGGL